MKTVLLTVAISFSAASAWAAPQAVTVDSPDDQDPNTCLPALTSGSCSLRAAVQAMNNGGAGATACGCTLGATVSTSNQILISVPAITLSVTGAQENGNVSGDIDIDVSGATELVISPQATTGTVAISSTGDDRIFDIHHDALAIAAAAPVTFDRLMLTGTGAGTTNGTSDCPLTTDPGDGGLVRIGYLGGGGCTQASYGAVVTLTGCTLQNGTATGNGGAIATQGANLVIGLSGAQGTLIQNNTASTSPTGGDGGGIYIGAGAAALGDGTIIGPNSAVNGGDIAAEGASLTITGTATASIIGSATASGDGGGIFASSGTVTLTNVSVTNDFAVDGGGVAFGGTVFIANGSAIDSNHATTGNGGGIFATAGSISVQKTSTVNSNVAGGSGGGIFIQQADATAPGSDCLAGGAAGRLSLCVNTSTVASNTANGPDGGGIALAPAGNKNQTADIVSSTIGGAGAGNTAKAGGGIYAGAGCGAAGVCTLSVSGTTISHNGATSDDGGGIDNLGFLTTLSGSTLDTNTAHGNGGGINNMVGGASLTASTGTNRFIGNVATGLGGGVYTAATVRQVVSLVGVHLGEAGAGNTAASGGGLFVDTVGPDSSLALTQSSVVGNAATAAGTGNGGGVDIDQGPSAGTTHPAVAIAGTDFTSNGAKVDGGGLYNATVGTVHTTVSGGTFAGNGAAQAAVVTQTVDGGAIFNHADSGMPTFAAVTPCTVASAQVFTVCNVTIGAAVAANANIANSGGGIGNDSSMLLGDSLIEKNTASGGNGGGGIFNAVNGNLYVVRTTITGNHAANDGGGVSTKGSGLLVADLIDNNDTLADGGGVSNSATNAPGNVFGILYSTIVLNFASSGSGGGVASGDGNTRLNNVTIADNVAQTGQGSGINSSGTHTQVANSIVDLNADALGAPNDCNGITSKGANIFSVGSSCLTGSDSADNDNATLNLNKTPSNFGGPTLVDALQPNSIAINAAGTAPNPGSEACGKLDVAALTPPAWLTTVSDGTDQRGVTVPQGAQCDIGAFEATPDLGLATQGNACPAVTAGGAAASYTVRVSNSTSNTLPASTDLANAIAVKFTLPAHVLFESVTPPSGTWTCLNPATSLAPSAGATGPLTFTCTLSSAGLGGGNHLDFGLSLALDAATPAGSNLIYSAAVDDTTGDPNAADNSLSDSCSVTNTVALTLTKTDGASLPIAAGSAPVYIITLSNAGPSAAVGVSIADAVPTTSPAVVSAMWTCLATGAGSSCPANGSGVINATVNLAPGGSVTFSDTVQTDFGAANGSTITNTVSATTPVSYTASSCTGSSNGACVSNSAANSCTSCDIDSFKAAVSELGVTKTAPATIGEGAQLVTVTTLTVAGPSSSQNITLTDIGGSAATSLVSYTLDAAATAHFNCSGAPSAGTSGTTTITCTSSGIVPTGTYVFTETSTVIDDGSTPPPVAYSATLAHSGIPNQLASGGLPDSASGSTTIDIESDAAITLSAPASVIAGDTLSYAITVTDDGPSTARNISWSMSVPTQTSFVSITAPSSWTCTPPSVGGTGALTCNAGALPAADGAQAFALVVTVDPAALNGSTISGSAVLGTIAHDPQLANNGPVTVSTTVASDADLAITLAASVSEVAQGGSVDYTIGLENNGPSDAQLVVVTVQLPADVTYKAIAATDLVCGTPTASGLVTCTLNNIAPGAAETAALSVTVSATATDGEVLTTTASVTSASIDTVAANDTASAQVTVNRNAAGNLPVTFGDVTVAHDQVRERGGFFRCDSMGGNGASDLAALLGAAFIATRRRARKRHT